MAAPLVTAVRGVRTLTAAEQTAAAESAYLERATRNTSSARFTRAQSISARALQSTRKRGGTADDATPSSRANARVQKPQERMRLPVSASVSTILSAQEKVLRMRQFVMLMPVMGGASLFIGIFGIIGLVTLFFSDTALGTFASAAVSILTFGSANIELVGMLFIGLSVCVSVAAYAGMLIYLITVNHIRILNLQGFSFIAAMILPVASMVPGINLIPWLMLWTFCLLMTPAEG